MTDKVLGGGGGGGEGDYSDLLTLSLERGLHYLEVGS